jgi:hypothetical protein
MTRPEASAPTRPLLVNGEALRLEVTAPRTAGGEKYEPQTPEQARALLLPQIQTAISTAQALDDEFRSADYVYIEARLLPNYIAAGQHPAALLNQVGAVPVGSRADKGIYRTRTREQETGTRRLVLAIADSGLTELSDLVQTGGRGRSQTAAYAEIRKFDEIAVADPDEVMRAGPGEPEESTTWEAVLHPSPGAGTELEPLDAETLNKWFQLVHAVGGEVYNDFIRIVGGLTFTPVAMNLEAAHQAARFNPLRAIRPMPSIRPRPSFGRRSVTKLQPPPTPRPVQDDPSVAIFDGGVRQPSTVLFPRKALDLTSEPPDPDDLDHGTGVTGAVLCGLAKPGSTAVQPPLPVDSFRVLPAPHIPGDLEGYWVLDQIKQAVIDGGYNIVNLSLGPQLAVEDGLEPNRWTSELDQLAWENDVLFVVAAGNDGDADRATGLHRVQSPGDMANGLTVGSCDSVPPAKPWARSPYSSMGPGRQGNRVQPLGVQFGGVNATPFPVLREDGDFLASMGTSFAAPLLTHALAELTTRLPRANPSILRAFSAHFAERHSRYKILRDEVGYGRLPLSFSEALDCEPDEVHVLYADEISRGELIGYQVPIPIGVGAVEVRFTMAYASPVEPSQPTEYTDASLDLTFRPHYRIFTLRPPKDDVKQRSVKLDIATDEAQELLNNGWLMSQEPVTQGLGTSGPLPEHHLRDSGKWETMRHTRLSLANGAHAEPRLEISYIARRAGGLTSSSTKIPFALLITVLSKTGDNTLYDNAAVQFSALRPVPRVRGRVRVRGNSAAEWR